MTADLSALIASLEAANRGCPSLDMEISEAIDQWWMAHPDRQVSGPWTQSLDAALALADRVLPEWAWEIRLDRGGATVQAAPSWWLEGLAAPDEGGVSCDGKTPAIATCIAILRAKQGDGA